MCAPPSRTAAAWQVCCGGCWRLAAGGRPVHVPRVLADPALVMPAPPLTSPPPPNHPHKHPPQRNRPPPPHTPGTLLIPQEPFELLVRRSIGRLTQPALCCKDLVHEELLKIAEAAAPRDLGRFPALQRALAAAVLEYIQVCVECSTCCVCVCVCARPLRASAPAPCACPCAASSAHPPTTHPPPVNSLARSPLRR
jgi:hypothetical protein